MRFQSDVDAIVTGVRFYKSAANTGTHTGSLWTSNGVLLATVTFTGETASGWQTATFSTPVQIKANTPYVVSYYATEWSLLANQRVLHLAGYQQRSAPRPGLGPGGSQRSVYLRRSHLPDDHLRPGKLLGRRHDQYCGPRGYHAADDRFVHAHEWHYFADDRFGDRHQVQRSH